MNTKILAALLFALVVSPVQAGFMFPNFSIDPASPAIDGNITPDDVLSPGPVVFIQGTSLGLADDFFGGVFDNLNALSYGQDPIGPPLFFSVDRVSATSTDAVLFGETWRTSELGFGRMRAVQECCEIEIVGFLE